MILWSIVLDPTKPSQPAQKQSGLCDVDTNFFRGGPESVAGQIDVISFTCGVAHM